MLSLKISCTLSPCAISHSVRLQSGVPSHVGNTNESILRDGAELLRAFTWDGGKKSETSLSLQLCLTLLKVTASE